MAYATRDELKTFMGREPGDGADRLLERASTLMDRVLVGRIYEIDPATGLPYDPVQADALRDAVCAQIEWWAASDDNAADWDSVAPRARHALVTGGFWRGITTT